jgi:hypothetical protein
VIIWLFQIYGKKCKALSNSVHANHICKFENNINIDVKFVWYYVNSLRSNRSNIPLSVSYDNSDADNINDITNLFANYFSSVYVTHNNINQ